MITALKDLGAAMGGEVRAQDDHSEIPATYIYLGQFIDHDITLEAVTNDIAHYSITLSNLFQTI